MKKSTLSILAILLCIAYGVLSWDIVTHSQSISPEDSQFAGICSGVIASDTAAADTEYDMCCIEYNEALEAVKQDWQFNLQTLIGQERAASDMVDDAYENLRTYNCWAEYICRAVQFSGHAPIESALGTGLKEEHLGTVPGCQSPDNLTLGAEYNAFLETIKDTPLIGAPVEAFGNIKVENKINYFPSCQTDANNNENPNINRAQLQYEGCKRALELQFGCPAGIDPVLCGEFGGAFVTLEAVLKKTHGDQKARALETKMTSLLSKMHTMEEHVNYLSNFLQQLDARFSCYAGNCS